MIKQLLFLIVFISVFNLYSQDISINDIEAKVDAMVPESINDSTPGLVIGVVRNGALVFSKGYGMANLSYDIPNDPKMVYNTGSVTKQFMGYAFAMLHVQGKLNLDDSVNTYMDNWPEFEEKVTLKNLLTHSSGYREAYAMSNLAGRSVGIDRLTREECLEVIRRQPKLEYPPGSRYTYNSTAWVVLAEVLEKVTGMPSDQWVIENILKPLEMNDTQIEMFVGDVIENAAESYIRRPDGQFENLKSNRAIFGAADIFSSIDDLAKWINNIKTAKVGGPEVQEVFLEPHILKHGVNSEYALGIGVSTYKGVRRYRHTGGHEAFATQLSYYPDQDLGIVTISNYGGTGWLDTAAIAELLIGSQMSERNSSTKTVKLDSETLDSYSGSYIIDSYNRTVDITIENDTLTLDRRAKFLPVSKTEFRQLGFDRSIHFSKGNDGTMNMTIKDNNSRIFTPYKSWSPESQQLKQYVGDFKSEELETIHHLEIKDGKLMVQNRWIGAETLEPLTNDVFNVGNAFYVKFERDSNNDIIGYNINTGRTLNVFFKKID